MERRGKDEDEGSPNTPKINYQHIQLISSFDIANPLNGSVEDCWLLI